jgi:sugar phosphate isomerase/epimerase
MARLAVFAIHSAILHFGLQQGCRHRNAAGTISGASGERLNTIIIAPTTLQDIAPIEYIEATAAAGYDGIGLRVHRSPGLPFYPVAGDARLIAEMKSRIADAGLKVFDLYSFYLEPDTDVERFAPAMEVGAGFGAKYATVMGDDADWSRQRDNFVKTCDIAAQFGLTCSLEFAVSRPVATLPQTVRLITEAERDAVICLDPLHLARSGASPADVKALDPKYFPYAQMSDGVLDPGEPDPARFGKLGLGTRAMPGAGMLPLRDLLAALPRDIPLSVELPHALAPQGTSARDWARMTLESTRKFLAEG